MFDSLDNTVGKIYMLLLMKEMRTLGQLSDEEYADLLNRLWSIDAPPKPYREDGEV